MSRLKITGRRRRSGNTAAVDGKGVCEGGWPHCQRTTTGTRHDNVRETGGEGRNLGTLPGKAASDGKHVRGNTGVGEVGRTNYRRRRTAISRTIRYVRCSGTKSYRARAVVSVRVLYRSPGGRRRTFSPVTLIRRLVNRTAGVTLEFCCLSF